MKRVIIESPYRGNVQRNRQYALRCMKDCLRRGEAPLASHITYAEVLDDNIPVERELGMAAGFSWMEMADLVAVYTDLGVSNGMEEGIKQAKKFGLIVLYRSFDRPEQPAESKREWPSTNT